MDDSDRFSMACFYNVKPAHLTQGIPDQPSSRSSVSPLQTPIEDQKDMAFSPVEQYNCSDEKIAIVEPVEQGKEVVESLNRELSHAPEVVPPPPPVAPPLPPPGYVHSELPARSETKPFWRRHILWIMGILGLVVLVIGVVAGVAGRAETRSPKMDTHTNTTTSVTDSGVSGVSAVKVTTLNNTRNSVASSGVFMNDGVTWNTHVIWQNSTGDLFLRISLDGQNFGPEQPVKLNIQPKIGSPLAATTEIDSVTGVVMLNIFYLSGVNNITMSAITCPPNSDKCNTIANFYLPTQVAPSNFTGLAAVNVNNAQDWRVFYHDEGGYISELQGDNSGFNVGKIIGGAGLNASSIAAVNVNSTTNNIHVFYVDALTKALFTTQFTAGFWTRPIFVSPALIEQWNPRSGLGAAYTVMLDQLHVYYTGLDLGIYEFLGSNASQTVRTSWLEQPGRNHLWAPADFIGAPITAVGWNDKARFYQIKDGNLAEGSLNNETWTESFVNDGESS